MGTGDLRTFKQLVDVRRHADHKILGVSYVLIFSLTLYTIFTDLELYERSFLVHMAIPFIGAMISMSALRNFKFLSKSNENPGMFAAHRTFSVAFIQENLWFQLGMVFAFTGPHPLCRVYFPPLLSIPLILTHAISREWVPKTSYVSWETGNNDVNKKKGLNQAWVNFINIQVKIVRWNFVFKKHMYIYFWAVATAEALFGLPVNSLIGVAERPWVYALSLDGMHNITTAFFFQTLKFKGFISAETFSFLFNLSPFLGIFTGYKLFATHTLVWPIFIPMLIDVFINLRYIYPSKLGPHIKNRMVTSVKWGLMFAGLVAYYVLYIKGNWVRGGGAMFVSKVGSPGVWESSQA